MMMNNYIRKAIAKKAEAYANSIPIPLLPPKVTQIITNAIKQAYLDGVKEGEYQAESRHADGHTVAYLKRVSERTQVSNKKTISAEDL